jgi:hypothetical protein
MSSERLSELAALLGGQLQYANEALALIDGFLQEPVTDATAGDAISRFVDAFTSSLFSGHGGTYDDDAVDVNSTPMCLPISKRSRRALLGWDKIVISVRDLAQRTPHQQEQRRQKETGGSRHQSARGASSLITDSAVASGIAFLWARNRIRVK